MNRRLTRSLVLIAAATTLVPAALAQDETEEFVQRLLRGLDVKAVECPDAVYEQFQGHVLVCSTYGAQYSAFKAALEYELARFDFAGAEPRGSWLLKDGYYRRTYSVMGDLVEIHFDRDSRRIVLAYEGIPDLDEPAAKRGSVTYDGPFFSGLAGATKPVLIQASAVAPNYPAEALEYGVSGSVILEGYVLKEGTVSGVDVMQADPAGQGLEEAAKRALGQWKFEPGSRDGKQVDVFFTVVFEFELSE